MYNYFSPSSQPSLLLIDSATSVLRLGLYHNGHLHSCIHDASPKHGEVVLGLIQGLCQQAGISGRDFDYLCWNRGPGSFTGIRLALSVIQAMAATSGARVVSLSSLALLAQQSILDGGDGLVRCLIDARMQRIYSARSQPCSASEGGVIDVTEETIITVDDLAKLDTKIPIVGMGMSALVDLLPEPLQQSIHLDTAVTSEAMLQLALSVIAEKGDTDIHQAQPVYLYEYEAPEAQ